MSASGQDVDWRVESAAEIAQIMRAGDALGEPGAVLVANPLPLARQLDPELHDRVLGAALAAAQEQGIRGKAVSPFLLGEIHRASAGASLDVNIDIAAGNVALGGQIASAWASSSA